MFGLLEFVIFTNPRVDITSIKYTTRQCTPFVITVVNVDGNTCRNVSDYLTAILAEKNRTALFSTMSWLS